MPIRKPSRELDRKIYALNKGMSLPGLLSQPVLQSAAALSPFDAIIGSFNTNPYFIGIMMLVLNLGGRFLAMDVTKEQEKIFQNPWFRRFIVFTVLFVATRNVAVAAVLTLFVVLVFNYLLNENSAMYIFGRRPEPAPAGPQPGMTVEEQEIFRRLNEKHMRMKASETTASTEEDVDDAKVYLANLTLLRNPI